MNSQVRVCQSQHYNEAPLRMEFIDIHLFLHRWHSTPLHHKNTATPRTSHLTNKCNKILGIKLIVGFIDQQFVQVAMLISHNSLGSSFPINFII